MALSGPIAEPKSGKVDNAVIMLHGLGADGNNLIGIADFLAADFPNTVFVAPNAPFAYDMIPPGYPNFGYQWFSLQDRSPENLLKGIQEAQPILDSFIDEVLSDYELPDNKLALLAFSQGATMATYTALRREKELAGILSYSGALYEPSMLTEKIVSKPDFCLVHGEVDEVVPFQVMPNAEAVLKEAGFNTESHARPNLDHSIDMEGLEIGKAFLKSKLA